MENENIEKVEEVSTQPNYQDYIDQINNLKKNTVSREQYMQLQDENRTLLTNLVNNQPVSTETTDTPKQPISELKKELFMSKDISDINYVKKALELRSRLLDEKGIDCFVGSSHTLQPSQEDYMKADKVAAILQECVNASNGSNSKFISELQERLVDFGLPRRR